MMRILSLIAAGALAATAPAPAERPAAAAFAPVAHSALVGVDGAVAGGTLVLRVRRSADQQPLTGAQLAVTVDGRSIPVTPRPEGTWGVPVKDLAAKPPGKLSIVVTHDGVREVLDGQLPGGAAAPPAGGSASGAGTLIHKQMAWWILNVVIVLIGVIAVSRRMS
ncbi:MAG TPA: hypothetical protein VH135_07750 [Steroidobacteraceae bacterium]|nr:hypothetical protein [Steroidobacteraceae bacterium]